MFPVKCNQLLILDERPLDLSRYPYIPALDQSESIKGNLEKLRNQLLIRNQSRSRHSSAKLGFENQSKTDLLSFRSKFDHVQQNLRLHSQEMDLTEHDEDENDIEVEDEIEVNEAEKAPNNQGRIFCKFSYYFRII